MTLPSRQCILVVYGTRPEVIKLAPVIASLRRRDQFDVMVGTTGQHRELLDQTQRAFGVEPDFDLGLMTPDQSLNTLTARALAALDSVLASRRPHYLLVQGDTTTAMAAALAAFHRGVPVGHVEAGLRTRDLGRPFPEEANRRVIDLVARDLFAPTHRAAQTLLAEGHPVERVHCVGNTVVDALQTIYPCPKKAPRSGGSNRRHVLITVHRRESFGPPLQSIFAALRQLATDFADVDWTYPVHPNPRVRDTARTVLAGLPNLQLVEPLPYPALVETMARSALVLTDSGGIQEEAATLGSPVLVLRDTTERPEGIEAGVARLVGTSREGIVRAAAELLASGEALAAMAHSANPYGDGRAGERIAAILAGEPWQPFDVAG